MRKAMLILIGLLLAAACGGGEAPAEDAGAGEATVDNGAEEAAETVEPAEAPEPVEEVLLYPEGNVQAEPGGAPRRVRSGAVRLAREHGAPLVPVAHSDVRVLGDTSVRGSLLRSARALLRRPRIVVAVGPPLRPTELEGLSTVAAGQLLRQRLTDQWRRATAALSARNADHAPGADSTT